MSSVLEVSNNQKKGGTKKSVGEEWRYKNVNLCDKMGHILETGEFQDVTFEVGDNKQLISAHRFVLFLNSSVFEAMFHGALAPSSEELISVPDIEPTAFRLFLKFIYTGQFEVDIEHGVGVLYAAKKYDVPQLAEKCVGLLLSNMKESNVVTTYQAAQLLDETLLQNACHCYIVKNFWKVVNTSDFLTMSHKNLCHFFAEDDLNILEIDLFHAALRWAEEECLRQDMELTAKNQRRVLNWAINMIRFPLMSLEEISLTVVPSKVLLPEEMVSLYQHMTLQDNEKREFLQKLWFNETERRQYKKYYTAAFAQRMTIEAYGYDMNSYREDSFQVDHPISIVSVGFPAPDGNRSITYDVFISLGVKEDKTILSEREVEVQVSPQKVFHIEFNQPISLKPNVIYTVTYQLKGPITHYIERKAKEIKVFYDAQDTIHFKYIPHHRQLVELTFTVV